MLQHRSNYRQLFVVEQRAREISLFLEKWVPTFAGNCSRYFQRWPSIAGRRRWFAVPGQRCTFLVDVRSKMPLVTFVSKRSISFSLPCPRCVDPFLFRPRALRRRICSFYFHPGVLGLSRPHLHSTFASESVRPLLMVDASLSGAEARIRTKEREREREREEEEEEENFRTRIRSLSSLVPVLRGNRVKRLIHWSTALLSVFIPFPLRARLFKARPVVCIIYPFAVKLLNV